MKKQIGSSAAIFVIFLLGREFGFLGPDVDFRFSNGKSNKSRITFGFCSYPHKPKEVFSKISRQLHFLTHFLIH